MVAGELAYLPAIGRPARSPAAGDGTQAARAVAFALGQRGKPYRWGAEGPHAFDCSGLTWAAWRTAGVTIPRTAAGQLARLPRVRGRLQPGDLVIYSSRRPLAAACRLGRGPGPDGRGPRPRHPGPVGQHPSRLPGSCPTSERPMTAAVLDVLGWEQLTAAEQASAVAGACLGLAAWLLARALFGGRRHR